MKNKNEEKRKKDGDHFPTHNLMWYLHTPAVK
jgi:hypothetical protein